MSYPQTHSGDAVRRRMMSFFVPSEQPSNWGSQNEHENGAAQRAGTNAKATHQEFPKTQPEAPFVKIQRKGSPQTCYLPISLVQTYEDFLTCLQNIFHNPSFITPEVVTFEGVLISDAWTYNQQLQPGLHLIIHFPLTIHGESPIIELPSDADEETPLSLEWVQNIKSPFANIPGGTRFQGESSTIDPAHITLTNIHPHSDMHHRIRKRPRRAERPLHFQPPALSFYPLSKVPIAVTLANSLIRKAVHCFIKPDENGEVSVEDIWTRLSANAASPVLGSVWWRALGRDRLFPSDGETTKATHPRGPIGTILSRPLPEGTFPLTTFDIFAQGSRRQIVCSVTWDATAHPSGQVSLANGGQKQNEISWDLGDVLKSKVSAAARTVHWVNYAPPRNFVPFEINSGGNENNLIDEEHQNESLQYTKFTSSSATSRRKSGKFWMLHPPRLLPAPFFPTEHGAGNEDVFFHLPHPKTELLDFFARIHRTLGFPEDKVKEIIYHWSNLLPGIEQRSTNGVIVKFLLHKEVSKIFPVEIEPMPAEFRRAFAVVWTLNSDQAWEIQQRESEEARIAKVVQGICSHGKSPCGVSLEGFKVFEWGGIVVPYGADEDDQGSESGSGSDTASDRTIRAPSSSFGEDDVLMEDVASSYAGEQPDTPMENGVDAVVLGDEGTWKGVICCAKMVE